MAGPWRVLPRFFAERRHPPHSLPHRPSQGNRVKPTKLTGESAENVVAVSVREHLALLDEAEAEMRRRAEIYALVKDLGTMFHEAGIPAVDHGEVLYDENVLPREGDLFDYELWFYFPERYTLLEGMDGGKVWRSELKTPKPSA